MQQSVKLWPRHRWFDPIPAHFTSPWRSRTARSLPERQVIRSSRIGDAIVRDSPGERRSAKPLDGFDSRRVCRPVVQWTGRLSPRSRRAFDSRRADPWCSRYRRRDGESGVRRILGVLTLVKKHGAVAVEDACAAALELAVADYRFVRRYLERQPAAPLTLRQVDPLIRDLTHYRDVIARKTQEEIPT